MIDIMTESKALGAKSARACDSCVLKRARWFCAADDAFLCQSCDAVVHSANQLASRHGRVRLGTSSFKGVDEENSSIPAWHQGFTKKARTPRPGKSTRWRQGPRNNIHSLPLVPEIDRDDDNPFFEESDDLLNHRVPIFETFGDDQDVSLDDFLGTCDEEDLVGSLLRTTNGSDDVPGINKYELDSKRVKVEKDCDDEVEAVIASHFDPALDMELSWDFDYASSMTGEDVGEETKEGGVFKTTTSNMNSDESQEVKKMMLLRLNYEAVIDEWAAQGSPWTNGVRPQFNLDEFMDTCLVGGNSHLYGGVRSGISDAGREARVLRYKEKRRTRLFSKKIRYQVRKLNAEKRPRMKGRFVKRTTFFSGSSLPNYLNMNK